MTIPIELGSTGYSIDVQAVNDAGLAIEGLLAATFPPLFWNNAGANATQDFPALSDLDLITSNWVAGGVKARGQGFYRLDIPDAIGGTLGVKRVWGEGTNVHIIVPPLVVVEVDAIAKADQYIDTSVDPWNVVYIRAGTGGLGVGVELLRKRLYDAAGAALTSTNTVVGQARQ